MGEYFPKIHFMKKLFFHILHIFILFYCVVCTDNVFARNETCIFPFVIGLLSYLSIVFIQCSLFYYLKLLNCFSLSFYVSKGTCLNPFKRPSSIKRLQNHLSWSGFQINAVVFLVLYYFLFQALLSLKKYFVASSYL